MAQAASLMPCRGATGEGWGAKASWVGAVGWGGSGAGGGGQGAWTRSSHTVARGALLPDPSRPSPPRAISSDSRLGASVSPSGGAGREQRWFQSRLQGAPMSGAVELEPEPPLRRWEPVEEAGQSGAWVWGIRGGGGGSRAGVLVTVAVGLRRARRSERIRTLPLFGAPASPSDPSFLLSGGESAGIRVRACPGCLGSGRNWVPWCRSHPRSRAFGAVLSDRKVSMSR